MDNFSNDYYASVYFYRREEERKAIRRVGSFCGLALLAYVLIQNIIALGIQAAGLWDKYTGDSFFQCGADIFLTFAGVLVPFAAANRFMKRKTGVRDPLIFDRRVSKGSLLAAVVAGSGLCMAANVVSSFFITVMSLFGFTLSSPDVPMPEGSAGFLLSFVRVVVVAAMAEELSLRGYVMGNLKKYGDLFAVGASAVLFAIMHGNLVQAPFALIAGFAIGYFTVKTGSLWTGILIHGVNNFLSLALSYIMEAAGEEAGALLSAAVIYGFGFVGVIGSVLFIANHKKIKLSAGDTVLSGGEKAGAFFFNIPMVLAFLLMVYITSNYIEFGR